MLSMQYRRAELRTVTLAEPESGCIGLGFVMAKDKRVCVKIGAEAALLLVASILRGYDTVATAMAREAKEREREVMKSIFPGPPYDGGRLLHTPGTAAPARPSPAQVRLRRRSERAAERTRKMVDAGEL